MERYIFCNKDGVVFAEYTSDNIKNKDQFSNDIRKQITNCSLKSAKKMGYTYRKSELEKYGLVIQG